MQNWACGVACLYRQVPQSLGKFRETGYTWSAHVNIDRKEASFSALWFALLILVQQRGEQAAAPCCG